MPEAEAPVATSQAAPPPTPTPGLPPPGTEGGESASGAAKPAAPGDKPLSAKEHAAIEKARYEKREAVRKLRDLEQQMVDRLKSAEGETAKERSAREALEKRLADLEEKLKRPLHGRPDAEAVIRDFVEGETPEKRTAAEIAEAKRVAREAVERAERIEKERERERQERETAQRQAHKAAAVDGFARTITSGDEAKRYRYLNAMHSPNEIRAMAMEIQEWAESEGKTFTYEQVALHLDKRAKSLYDERAERLQALRPDAPGGTSGAGLAPPAQTGRAGNGSAGNGHRTPGPGDAKPTKLSKYEQREREAEEDMAALRKAAAADAAAKNREAKAAKH